MTANQRINLISHYFVGVSRILLLKESFGMTSFSLIHYNIDYVHLMHEIDSFKPPKEAIGARVNRMSFLELIVWTAGAGSNEFANKMLYSLHFA